MVSIEQAIAFAATKHMGQVDKANALIYYILYAS
jgi:hypothetical protein